MRERSESPRKALFNDRLRASTARYLVGITTIVTRPEQIRPRLAVTMPNGRDLELDGSSGINHYDYGWSGVKSFSFFFKA